MKYRRNRNKTIHVPSGNPPCSRSRPGLSMAGFTLLVLIGSLLPIIATAQPLLDLGTATGLVGDTVLLPVQLSGLIDNVWSYELNLHWNQNYGSCTGISLVGTLSSGWVVDYLAGPGTVTISGANATAISSDGVLIQIEFTLGPFAGYSGVYLDAAIFNEGFPAPNLAHGSITATALPVLNIYPDSGLMAIGDSLSFSTSGGTTPYTYSSSNPLVADFQGGNWLYATGPGFVSVHTQDLLGYTDDTTGLIEVRAFDLEALDLSATAGDTILIPIQLSDPAAFAIISGEFEASWYAGRLEFIGLETAGTLIETAGWASALFMTGLNTVYITAAGSTPLPGPGVFVYLRAVANTSTWINLTPGIFNEIYPALPNSGYISVMSLPALGVSPFTPSLLVGDLQQFTVTGSYVGPLSWSVDNPALAMIDGAGQLTALGEGLVRVSVQDNLGAMAQSGSISICALALPSLVSAISANDTLSIPVFVDRDISGMGIYSCELEITFAAAYVEFLGASTTGTTTMAWGTPYVIDEGGLARIVIAGAEPLTGCGPAFINLIFRGLPGLGFSYTGIALQSALFNEGSPCAWINARIPCPYSGVDIPAITQARLLPNHPNPFNPSTTIRFLVENPGPIDLSIYSARGERIRRLVAGPVPIGRMQSVIWDGRYDSGQAAASGIYYYRLSTGGETLMRKMALLR